MDGTAAVVASESVSKSCAPEDTAPVIDNQHYSYLLQVVLTGPGVCLAGAQVIYRQP